RCPHSALHVKLLNFSMKCGAHMPYVPGEFDNVVSRGYADSRESMRSEPTRNSLNIGVGRTVLGAKLWRRQPFVKIGRLITHLLGHELLQCRFLFWAALQEQYHSFHRRSIAQKYLIEFRAGDAV